MSARAVTCAQRERLRSAFVSWLGSINARRASTRWWAFATSSKNLLSSPLGHQVLALAAGLHTFNAGESSVSSISVALRAASTGSHSWPGIHSQRTSPLVKAPREFLAVVALRILSQAASVFATWFIYARPVRIRHAADIVIFTYADRTFSADKDAYFGRLSESFGELPERPTTLHIAYVQGGYKKYRRALAESSDAQYVPLFAALRLNDIVHAMLQTIWALLVSINSIRALPRINGADTRSIVRNSMLWDLGKGGYFHNLLVFRSIARFAHRLSPKKLIYPYENKSLEKMLLVASRRHAQNCRLIGYQHTSLTNRHTSLLFAPGEAERTPLPDCIVTTGTLARKWLETHGNYPDAIFKTGVALRQQFLPPFRRRLDSSTSSARLLFVPSSSLSELLEVALFLIDVHKLAPNWKLAIRTHPEFPLSLLDRSVLDALEECARDVSGTKLSDNLEWCDAVAYVSSTVALESLIVGRPVVHIETDELLSSDPTLGTVPLRWTAESPADLVQAVMYTASMHEAEFEKWQQSARDFVDSYLQPPQSKRTSEIFS